MRPRKQIGGAHPPKLGAVAARWRFQVPLAQGVTAGNTAKNHNDSLGSRAPKPSFKSASGKLGGEPQWRSEQTRAGALRVESVASMRLVDEAEQILRDLDLHDPAWAADEFQNRMNQGDQTRLGASKLTRDASRPSSSDTSWDSDDESVQPLGSLAGVDAMISRRQLESEVREFGRADKVDELVRLRSGPPSPILSATAAPGKPSVRPTSSSGSPSTHPSFGSRSRAASQSSPTLQGQFLQHADSLTLEGPAHSGARRGATSNQVKPGPPPKSRAPNAPPRLAIRLPSPSPSTRHARASSPTALVLGSPTPSESATTRHRSNSVMSRSSISSVQRRPSLAESLTRFATPRPQQSPPPAQQRAMEASSFVPKTFTQSDMGMGVWMSCKSPEERDLVKASIEAKGGLASMNTFRALAQHETALAGSSSSQPPPELRVEWRAMQGSRLELMLPPNPPERVRGGHTADPNSSQGPSTKDTSVRRPGGVADQLGSMMPSMRPGQMPAGRFLLPSTAFAADAGVNTLRVLEMKEAEREIWLRKAFAHSSKLMDRVAAKRAPRPFRTGRSKLRPIRRSVPVSRAQVNAKKPLGDPLNMPAERRASVLQQEAAHTATRLRLKEEAVDVAQRLHRIDPPFLFRSFCRVKGAELTAHVQQTLDQRWKEEGKAAGWNMARLRANKTSLLDPDAAEHTELHIPAMLHSLPLIKNKTSVSRRDRKSMQHACGAVTLTLDATQAHVDAVQ